jgi:molecular chaperone GrpE (heat shock protein)
MAETIGKEIEQAEEKSTNEQSGSSLGDLSIRELLGIITSTSKKIGQLEELFNQKLYDDHLKENIFKRLVEELSYYKENFVYENILRRIFGDLIRLFDRIGDTIEYSRQSDNIPQDITDNLVTFKEEIIEILRRQDVISIQKEMGKFDEEYQEAVGIEATDNPEENLLVARIVKNGFKYKKRLLRPEIVVVKKFTKIL